MSKLKEAAENGMYRESDHATSVAAAVALVGDLKELQTRVFKVMLHYPDGLTDPRLNQAMVEHGYEKRPEATYRKRRTELFQMGIVELCGHGDNGQGSKAKIWRIKPEVRERMKGVDA